MKIFTNANIVTPDEILENHCLAVNNGKITAIGQRIGNETAEIIDCHGGYLMPGIIDIHSDMIENLLQPRSTAMMSFQLGLDEAEKQLCACGITTIYHSVSMYKEGTWDSREIRSAKSVKKLSELIKKKKTGSHLIHNKYHLRYELDNIKCYDNVLELMDNGNVDLLSIMDHRPGQGQYKDLSIYRRHLPNQGRDLSDEEFAQLVEREQTKPMIEGEKLTDLVKKAKSLGIPVSSHDDDSSECIQRDIKLGVDISEFPITLEVAKEAKSASIAALLGAPNILLGGSHSGNLSAEVAVKEGCGDILCSDYYPQALLRAVFYLANKGVLTLPQAVKLVSLNPAKAVKIGDETGSLEVGKTADMLVIEKGMEGQPVLKSVYIDGVAAMAMNYSEVQK